VSARKVLAAVKGKLDVSAFLAGLADKYVLTSCDPAPTVINRAPVKVRARLARLVERGRDAEIRSSIAIGHNPFPESGDVAIRFIVDVLIDAGSVTRPEVVQHLTKHGWAASSARSHTSNVLALLEGLQVIERTDDTITINRHIQRVPILT
jgi:hypothetical protein